MSTKSCLCEELVKAVNDNNIDECENVWKIINSDTDKYSCCIKWAPRAIRDECHDISYSFYLELQYGCKEI